jgi:hypothetical protein
VNVSKKRKATQDNWTVRLLHPVVPGKTFREAAGRVPPAANLRKHLWFRPVGAGSVALARFSDQVTGEHYFCSCARGFHEVVTREARSIAPRFVPDGWPHRILAWLCGAKYLDGICHLCLGKSHEREQLIEIYGTQVFSQLKAYVAQWQQSRGVSKRTAKLEVMRTLGVSQWKRETDLFVAVCKAFDGFLVEREASPPWLGRQRLDVFIPEAGLAFEHQGQQHFEAVGVFGGKDALERNRERDARKRDLCAANGVALIEVRFDEAITIAAIMSRARKYLPPGARLGY